MMSQKPRLARRAVPERDEVLTIDLSGAEPPADQSLDTLVRALDRAILRQAGRSPQEGSR